ncbi:MAG: outer membrane protein assembly factor [Akkermansiaceae bacterium]
MSRFRRAWFSLVICSLISADVAIGEETTVDIRGMRSKSEAEIMALIGGRLSFVKEKPANSWRANDAAFMVEKILRNDGFSEANVVAKIEGQRRIVLQVEEGIRFSLGEVKILGEEEADAEKLAELFSVPFGGISRFGGAEPPFRDEEVPVGIEFITHQLNSEGFWNAAVTLQNQEIDRNTGEVGMSISVNRGQQFKIGQPTVSGADERGREISMNAWKFFVGKWATTENINGLRAAMTEAFSSRGYPDVSISMARRLTNGIYYPDFTIILGVRVKLLEVYSEGLVKTDKKRIDQIMSPLEGDWYDEAAMNKRVKGLLQTGAFDSIELDTQAVGSREIDATLRFKEAKAKILALTAGVDSFDGPLFRAKYTNRNWGGTLRALTAGMELSGRGTLGEISLSEPWWHGSEMLRTQRLFSLIKGYDGYTSYQLGYSTNWKLDLSEHYALQFALGLTAVVVSEQGLPDSLLGDTEYGNLFFKFIQTWDYRDNPVVPKSGWHLSVPLEIGTAAGNEINPYFKAGIDGGVYLPLNKDWQLGVGGFANWVFPTGDLVDLPIDLRVFNGGARSVRSFPERELGPSFKGEPYGGDFSWAMNTELSKNISSVVQAVAFVDAGSVTGEYTGIREGGLELAAGLGIRLNLPIGPVRLEYGHNLTQGAGEPSGSWHFAIGSTF